MVTQKHYSAWETRKIAYQTSVITETTAFHGERLPTSTFWHVSSQKVFSLGTYTIFIL